MNPYLKARLDLDIEKADALELSNDFEAATQLMIKLRHDCMEGDWRRGDTKKATDIVNQILDIHIKDSDLWMFTLASVLIMLTQRGLLKLAQQVSQFLNTFPNNKINPEVQMYIIIEQARFVRYSQNSDEALKLMEKAWALPIETSRPLWSYAKWTQGLLAIDSFNSQLTEEIISEIKAIANPLTSQLFPCEYLEMFLTMQSGKYETALKLLNKIQNIETRIDPKRLQSTELQLLIYLKRNNEFRKKISQYNITHTNPIWHLVQAELALKENNSNKCIEHLQNAETYRHKCTQIETEWLDALTLNHELAQHQVHSANLRLEKLHPQKNNIQYLLYEARLSWQRSLTNYVTHMNYRLACFALA